MRRKLLVFLVAFTLLVVVLPLVAVGLHWAFGHGGFYLFLTLLAAYGWALFCYFHYRQGRQEELLHVLTTAADMGAPLAPALRAYVFDRPRGVVREFWVGLILLFLVPGYYWIWHRRHRYEAKVHHVAGLLEQGVPLHGALRATPGVASGETLLAAAVGESTGRLAASLRGVPRSRLAPVWIEAVPRFLYPFALLLIIFGVLSFLMLYIAPKFARIHRDIGVDLPDLTKRLFDFGAVVIHHAWLLAVGILSAFWVGVVLYFSPTACWYCPGFGRLYRMHQQSRLLKLLGILLENGKPVPEALAILIESGYFKGTVQRRLQHVWGEVWQGEPLTRQLRQANLLPASMVPLLESAERARNLPWILSELGEHLANRTVVLLRRWSLIYFPISVVAVGLLVGFIVVGMFLPLVTLMAEIGQ